MANAQISARQPLQPLAYPEIFRGRLAAVFLLFVTDLGALVECTKAGPFHRGYMDEHVLAAVVGLNKSEALCRIEPLHSTCRHVSLPFATRGISLRRSPTE
jgi:hypothetical protein